MWHQHYANKNINNSFLEAAHNEKWEQLIVRLSSEEEKISIGELKKQDREGNTFLHLVVKYTKTTNNASLLMFCIQFLAKHDFFDNLINVENKNNETVFSLLADLNLNVFQEIFHCLKKINNKKIQHFSDEKKDEIKENESTGLNALDEKNKTAFFIRILSRNPFPEELLEFILLNVPLEIPCDSIWAHFQERFLSEIKSEIKEVGKEVEKKEETEVEIEKVTISGNLLLLAAKQGDQKLIATLCEQNLKILDFKTSQQEISAVLVAAANGQFELLKYLVKAGSSLEVKDQDGRNALLLAVRAGHLEMVEWLIKQGCSLDVRTNDGMDLVLYAANNGHLHILKYLHRTIGRSLEVTDANNAGPVLLAAYGGHLAVLKYLAAMGCSFLGQTNGSNPASLAAEMGHLEVLKFLVSQRVELTQEAVWLAAYNGRIEILEWFVIDRKVDLNKILDGMCAVLMAVEGGQLEALLWLLEKGCSLTVKTSTQKLTPVLLAVKNGDLAMLQLLVKKGCLLNKEDKKNQTPLHLHFASKYAHLPILAFLVEERVLPLNVTLNDLIGHINKAFKKSRLDIETKKEIISKLLANFIFAHFSSSQYGSGFITQNFIQFINEIYPEANGFKIIGSKMAGQEQGNPVVQKFYNALLAESSKNISRNNRDEIYFEIASLIWIEIEKKGNSEEEKPSNTAVIRSLEEEEVEEEKRKVGKTSERSSNQREIEKAIHMFEFLYENPTGTELLKSVHCILSGVEPASTVGQGERKYSMATWKSEVFPQFESYYRNKSGTVLDGNFWKIFDPLCERVTNDAKEIRGLEEKIRVLGAKSAGRPPTAMKMFK